MAEIKPVGTDIVSGQDRTVTASDALIVNNIYSETGDVLVTTGGGAELNLFGGDSTVGNGGLVRVSGGDAFASGGSVEIRTGNPAFYGTDGAGGNIDITVLGAAGTDQAGGDINITAGASTGTGTAGGVQITAGNADDGDSGSVTLTAGTTNTGTNGIIIFNNEGADRWFVELQPSDPDWPEGSLLRGVGTLGQGHPAIVQGPNGANDGTLIIRGGSGENQGGEGGGSVFVTGGTADTGGAAGTVEIGTYLHTPSGGGYQYGTRHVIMGAEDNPDQIVEIFNFYTPTMTAGGTDNDIQPLMLLQPGYQTFGPNTGVVLNFGPVYYDPNTGETIRLGPNTVYIEGNGTDNFVRGQNGNEPFNSVLFTLPAGPQTYDLADNSIAPPSPMAPGSVVIRVILASGTAFSTVTDDGAGAFPVSAVLPAGGTVNYTTGDLTGVTASLETKSQVTALYTRANAAGEPLTPKGGNGVGTGAGGELRLYGGKGGATANGGFTEVYGGDGGSTSGDGNIVRVGGGWADGDGVGGEVLIEGGQAIGSNKTGATVTVKTGIGTGTGAPGSLQLQTSTIEASGTTQQSSVDRVYINGSKKALTDNTPINLFEVALTAGQRAGGYVTFDIEASDGTDHQARSGIVFFTGVNKAGTVTTSATAGTTDVSASAGTLTQTWASTAGANKFTISLNADSSLTTTTLDVMYTVHLDATQLITIL